MSEQQGPSDHPATTATATTDSEPGGADDREPKPERQAELRAAYEANVAAGKAPYDGVKIRTRGELSWVVRERRWLGKWALAAKGEQQGYGPANLSWADFHWANLSAVDLSGANLSGARFDLANLSKANLWNANLSEASLWANLSEADLSGANLSGATLNTANLRGTKLNAARMDATTTLGEAQLDSHTLLADVVWNGAPVTRLNWDDVAVLGDERVAHRNGFKDTYWRLRAFQNAVLANRQVATVLRSQGLNEHADRFAYRAQLCQRHVLRMQRHYLRYLGSLFLGLLAGYGYRPLRSFIAYLLVVVGFAGAYFAMGATVGPALSPGGAVILSIISFHGRGFFPQPITLDDPIMKLVAAEAIIGLLIEITFIATFTNRFFAR